MADSLIFELKRHENILSSLARYMSGHTDYVNDFGEGSITRSLLEGLAQEIYRQNVSYAQGITTAIDSAIRIAFNQPLLDSVKATGLFTAYRKMLDSPSSLTASFSSATSQFTGSITGISFSATNLVGTLSVGQGLSGNGVAEGTYIASLNADGTSGYVGPGAIVTGSISSRILTVTGVTTGTLGIGHTLTGTNIGAPCAISAFLTGTGGVGTYYLTTGQSVAAGTTITANAQSLLGVSFTAFGLLQPASNFTATVNGANQGSGTGATISWSATSNGSISGTILPVSAGSGYVLGNVLQLIGNGGGDSNALVVVTGVDVSTKGVTSVSLLFGGTNYTSAATCSSVSVATGVPAGIYYYSIVPVYGNAAYGYTEGFGTPPLRVSFNSASYITCSWSAVSFANGYRIYRSTSSSMINASYTFVKNGTTVIFYDTASSVYVANKWPGLRYSYGVSAANLTNGARKRSAAYGQSVTPSNSVAQLSWKSVTSIDAASTPIGYNVYKATFDVSTPAPIGVYGQLSGTAGSLNYGAQCSLVSFSGNIMTVLVDTAVTFGSFASGQTITSSSSLLSNTVIVSQLTKLLSASGKGGTYLVNQTYPTAGTGAKLSWTTVNSGVINSPITVAVAGSGYAIGDVLVISGSGGGNAIVSVATVSGTGIASVNLVSGGTSYSANGTEVPTTSGVVQNIYSGIQYYYKVATLTTSGESAASNAVTISPTSSFQSAYISWSSVSGAIGYRVYRDTTALFKNPYFFDVTSLYFIDTNSDMKPLQTAIPSCFLLSESSNSNNLTFIDYGNTGTNASWPYSSDAFSVQGSITIPSGTQVSIPSTTSTYKYTQTTTMGPTSTSVDALIQSDSYGIVGNTGANSITFFVNPIYGISGGTNPQAFINGKDIETNEEWRSRFIRSLQSQARGTKDAILAGAIGTKVYDANGFVYDEVTKAIVTEPSALNVYVYIHNSTSAGVSSDLVLEAQKIIDGYVLSNGTKIPGYKAAGIPVLVFGATLQTQDIVLDVTTKTGFPFPVVKENLILAINSYFSTLDISDGFSIPSITSVTLTSGVANQNVQYQYRIVAVDNNNNRSAPSDVVTFSGGNISPNNVLVWQTVSSGPTIASYDVLRWNGDNWALVSNVVASSPYLSGSTMTFTDTSTSLYAYSFTEYNKQFFQKNALVQSLLRVPGVLALSAKLPTSALSDQTSIIPPLGTVLVPGAIYIN